MKYCGKYAALLDLYVDGELSGEEMERVRDHLAACPGCQAYVDDALAIRAAFPSVEETEVPAGFAGGVMAAIQAAPGKPANTSNWWKPVWTRTLLPLAACFAIVILLQSGLSREKTAADQFANTTVVTTSEAASSDAVESPAAAETESVPEKQSTDTAPWYPTSGSTDREEPGNDVFDAAKAAPAPCDMQEIGPYFATLTLSAEEVGALLDTYTPIQESDTERCYELTSAQYTALLSELSREDEGFPAETGSAVVLVIVQN